MWKRDKFWIVRGLSLREIFAGRVTLHRIYGESFKTQQSPTPPPFHLSGRLPRDVCKIMKRENENLTNAITCNYISRKGTGSTAVSFIILTWQPRKGGGGASQGGGSLGGKVE